MITPAPRAELPALPVLIAFVNRLCDISERIALSRSNKHSAVTEKDDATPVTETDRRIEHALRKEIKKAYPDHGVIGEEYGSQKGASPYSWIIDPIDGTLAFMTGRPLYGTLIAFCSHGVPMIGVVNQPDTKRRWIGVTGKRALCNGRILRTSDKKTLEKAIISTTSPDYFTPDEYATFERVKATTKYAVYGGNCIDYAMLAEGKIDVVMEAGLKPYDVAALAPVVKAAGGVITDWQGRGLNLSLDKINVVAAANNGLHQAVMSVVNGK